MLSGSELTHILILRYVIDKCTLVFYWTSSEKKRLLGVGMRRKKRGEGVFIK